MAARSRPSGTIPTIYWNSAAPEGGLLLAAVILLAGVAVITLLALFGINVDLALAALLAGEASPRFPAANNALAVALRDRGWVANLVLAICAVLVIARYLPKRVPSLPLRTFIYLGAAYLLGPGLLVNSILKSHWGRPRPAQLMDFGGSLPFVNWWDWGGACPGNCSFISGEAASAAWLFGPAMFVPSRWRPVAMLAAAAFYVLTSALRMAAGGHFLSDVMIAGLSSILILLALRPLFYPDGLPVTA